MASKKLIVLGSVNADHVLQVDSFPRPGETVTGHGYKVLPGGKGANQAVAAARLGGEVGFVACVGDDDFGSRMIKAFRDDGMDTRAVMAVPDMPTGVALIQVAANGENSIAIAAEANASLTVEALEQHLEYLGGAGMLLMQLESPIETVELAARTVASAGGKVVLNPAPAQPLSDDLLFNLAMITPNETEAEVLTGVTVSDEDSARQAADILHGKGIETVIITLGAQGAYCSGPDGAQLITGFSVKATDTTAAGDTFNGGLVVALQEGKAMDDAIRFAHAAAAISVTRLGAQTSIPNRGEVEEFLTNN
ncbi:ribokinase [Pseudodesulfovibrio profundus]|uniref:Ribokinase n=1 Tax=Pseudodesulfovibrio profundus TaxID=57320 RepID=A0A2C8FCX2_9BACT|nr:ribokinase [Pseudodesulfovibrio profundus]SOB60346.1 ribokinase [Pseudodesulfovibrio profundus]